MAEVRLALQRILLGDMGTTAVYQDAKVHFMIPTGKNWHFAVHYTFKRRPEKRMGKSSFQVSSSWRWRFMEPKKKAKVCEFHFPVEDIYITLGSGKKKLKPGVVPTKFEFKIRPATKARKPPKNASYLQNLQVAVNLSQVRKLLT